MASLFTQPEQAALKTFRVRVSDLLDALGPLESHDANLIRWLRARDLNVDKAEEMIRKSMKWREDNNIGELSKDTIADDYLEKFMPMKPGGWDKQGNLVLVCPFGRWDVKGMIEAGYKDKMFRHMYKLLELFSRHLQSVRPEKVRTQLVIIFDYDQFSMKQVFSHQTVSWLIEFFRQFDANYPERMKTAFVVNVPKIFEIFWPMINKVLSARTVSKVSVLGGGPDQWRAKLRESIASYELPSELGGSNTTQNFFLNRLGLSIYTLPRSPAYPGEDYITIDVLAKEKVTRSFPLVVGNLITWNFRTDLYDIGFEVTLNGERMFPYAKVDSHICVQDGRIDVIEDGVYELVFDNTYSRYRSKTLHYVVYVGEENVTKL